MEDSNNDKIMQILYSISDFKDEMIKSMNYIRGDIKDLKEDLKEFKEETNKRWEENNRRWEENNRRWEENDRRWEENNKLWKENKENWAKYEKNRVQDRDTILGILLNYDISISEQLGDPNVEKMRKIV